MSWIENLLIIAGVSLDLFAAMECQGSLVRKVNKRHLSLICLILAVWQLAALFVGHFLSNLILEKRDIPDNFFMGEIIAIVIFVGLGVRLVFKAIKNERIHEHLEKELGYRRFIRMANATSVYTLLAGLAFGFFGTNLVMILVMIGLITIAVIVAGMYTGYHFGFENKRVVYYIGAGFLIIAGADLIVRTVLTYR